MPPRTDPAPTVQIAAEGATVATTRLWRFRGQLRVTVIVKATFALVQQGLMKLGRPEPIFTADVHHGNNPVRSVRFTSDLAPYLPGTDVLLTGHAYALQGERVPVVTAGIALLDGYEPILEKFLDVRGDMGPDGIQPFKKMPLVYERGFGGPGWEDNPFGVGTGGARGEPNIVYIGNHRRSAGFGPWPSHWPARKKLVSSDVRKALSAPIADLPEGFDWTYFHAAPPDQRCRFLSGSEWVVLQGLRPDQRRVRSRLPAVKARALVFWADEPPEQEPLELIADTLRVDSDRGVCSLAWRKSFAVADETDLVHLRVLAGVEIGGQPISWSLPGAAPKVPPSREEPPPFVRKTTAHTVTLSDADLEIISERLDVDESGSAEDDSHARRALPPPAQIGSVRDTAPDDTPPPGVAPPRIGIVLGAAPPAGGGAPAPPSRPMILGSFRLAVFSPDYHEDPDDPLLSTLVIRNRPSPAAEPFRSTVVMKDEAAVEERLGSTIAMRREASPAAAAAPLKATLRMEDDAADDELKRTLVFRDKAPRAAPAAPLKSTLRMEDAPPPAEPFHGTVALRAIGAPAAEPPGRPLVIRDVPEDAIVDDPSATTLVLRNKPSPPGGAAPAVGRPVGDLGGPPESTTGLLPGRGAPPPPGVGLAGPMVIDDEDTEDTGPPPPEGVDPDER